MWQWFCEEQPVRGQSLSAHPWSTVLEFKMSEDRWATEGCTEGITDCCLLKYQAYC